MMLLLSPDQMPAPRSDPNQPQWGQGVWGNPDFPFDSIWNGVNSTTKPCELLAWYTRVLMDCCRKVLGTQGCVIKKTLEANNDFLLHMWTSSQALWEPLVWGRPQTSPLLSFTPVWANQRCGHSYTRQYLPSKLKDLHSCKPLSLSQSLMQPEIR